MQSSFYHAVIRIVFCLSIMFIGCGGGGGGDGGGGGGGGGVSGLSYNGITAPAEIDQNNATAIAAGAFAAGQTGTVMTGSQVSQDYQSAADLQIDNFRTLKLPRILSDAARSMQLNPQLQQLYFGAQAVYAENGTELGPCGGSFTYTISINKFSGEFEGTFKFSNYCDHGVTINGNAEVEGWANPDTGGIISISLWFDRLTDGAMMMDGRMSLDLADSPFICTLHMLLKDLSTGKVYWAKNYSLNIYEYPGRIEVEIFGTFYHPNHGYVTITTEEVFILYDEDEWPSSGVLLMVGAQNTRVKLTAVDETRCRVEADTDGDGIYDWDSGLMLWSDYQPFDQIEISGSYVQYRTYGDPADNRYQGWVEFENGGQPIVASDIEDIVLIDPDQNEVDIDQMTFDRGDYYFGYWDSGTQQVVYSGPWFYTGFSIYFPEAATFMSGHYTYEATTVYGTQLSVDRYFPGKLELAVVDSSTMASEWIDNDLKLTWTNPDPGGPFDEVRVRLFSEENGFEIYLIIKLPKTASEVIIPQQWINNVKQLSATDTMSWYILLYAYENSTNNEYARSISDSKAIDDWDDVIPPTPQGQIQNPGFEEGASEWFKSQTSGTDCTFTIDPDAHEGAQAAKLTVTNDGYCMLGNSTPIPIEQTGTYQFNSYAKVSGDIDHLTIAIWKSEDPNETPDTLVDYINPTPASGAYEQQQLSVDLAAGDYIRLELGIDNAASGLSTVLFDSLELIGD